MQKFS